MGKAGLWIQRYYRELWAITAVSHLIHLAQIRLYYTLGQSCPVLVWVVTLPMWLTILGIGSTAVFVPRWFDIFQSQNPRLYEIGSWYSWFVFTLAFSLGAATQHLLFYNLPAVILFIAAALLRLRPHIPAPSH